VSQTNKGKSKRNFNPNVKGVGQECPTHTGNLNINCKTKIKVNGVGQECPTHTGGPDGSQVFYEIFLLRNPNKIWGVERAPTFRLTCIPAGRNVAA